MIEAFEFQSPTRVVFGPGRLDELGRLAAEQGMRRVMVVSDPGIVRAGHTARGVASLEKAGLEVTVFDQVPEDPSTDDVVRGQEAAWAWQPDGLVGLGGGSSLDCAKGINFVFTNGGQMEDYWGVGKARRPMLPMIAVPTTAGTGSEAQSFALISSARTKAKMACGDKRAACRIALLDPSLTLTQPPLVTAVTGLDALAHALETYVTKRRNAASLAFSREAWRLLAANLPRVLSEPDDLDARSAMQLGACWAGMAIENSMLGAAHALANPLTARYGVIHGEAVGMMLPHVVRFNAQAFPHWYDELALLLPGDVKTDGSGGEKIAQHIEQCIGQAGLASRISQRGADRRDLPKLATDAAQQWTGTFNPRDVQENEWLELYERAW